MAERSTCSSTVAGTTSGTGNADGEELGETRLQRSAVADTTSGTVHADSKAPAEKRPRRPLSGRTAIVTGGAGTIGKAIAKTLLSSGAAVVIAGRRLETLEAAVRQLERYGRIVAHATDVTCEESVEALFAEVDRQAGSCDILVNNAGTNAPGPTEGLSAAVFNAVMATNVLGPFLCAREAFKRMKRQATGGRIINVGSIASASPRPDTAAYTASKYALQGLTRSLALDGRAHGIAVGAVHPGNVISDMIPFEEVERRRATEGFITPEVVADSVLHMASLPAGATVLDLVVMPTAQPLVGRG